MFRIRQIVMGYLLALVAAGPLPLWIHHLAEHADCSNPIASNGPYAGHDCAFCRHRAERDSPSEHKYARNRDDKRQDDKRQDEKSHDDGVHEDSLLGDGVEGDHLHGLAIDASTPCDDCLICYQLSQSSTSVKLGICLNSTQLAVPIAAFLPQVDIVDSENNLGARGPPTAC